MPKISVLTPLYNTEPDQLKEMIESVLAQSFSDFEFLLLNDSPDNTELESLVKGFSDPRIRFFSNEENLGISESRNKLLGLASGDYIAILDHDDICYPTRLEKEAAYLDSHPDVGVCSSWADEIPSGRMLRVPESNEDIKRGLLSDCAVIHSAAMIRKDVLLKNHIRWEAVYSPAEDYMLWVKLMEVTMFYNHYLSK